MSRFRFRLQRVLELREEAERARAVALADAESQAAAARQAREAIVSARVSGRESITHASQRGNTVGTLQQMQFVLNAMDVRLQVADSSVMTADSLVRHAQDELRAAFQARHALHTLREKQAEAHRATELHTERTLMDEIALTRFQNTDSPSTTPEHTSNG